MALYLGTERVKIRTAPYVRYNIVGNPTIVDGVASDFTSSDYLELTQTFQDDGSDFEIKLNVTPTNTQGRPIMGVISTYSGANSFIAQNGGAFRWKITSDNVMTFTTSYSINTNYDIYASRTNGVYHFSFGSNGTTIEELTLESSALVNGGNARTFALGCDKSTFNDRFPGSINLYQSYIKRNGLYWWDGNIQYAQTYTLH